MLILKYEKARCKWPTEFRRRTFREYNGRHTKTRIGQEEKALCTVCGTISRRFTGTPALDREPGNDQAEKDSGNGVGAVLKLEVVQL